MIELSLLKALSLRKNLESYVHLINPKTLSKESIELLKDYQAYFGARDPVQVQVDWSDFSSFFFIQRHPHLDDKSVEKWKQILDKVQKVSLTDTSCTEIITAFEQQEFYAALHQDLDRNLPVDEVLQKVQQLKDRVNEFKGSQDDLEGDMDLQVALETTDRSKGLQWRLKCLNELFQGGGLIKGDFGIIAGYVDCYSEDTEILTSNGWKLFKDINLDTKVAQYDNGQISFVSPIEYFNREYNGDMINFKSSLNRIDLLVTPNHKMLRVTLEGQFKQILAKDLNPSSLYKWKVSGLKEGMADNLSDYERFLIAYQADGSGPRKGCTGTGGHFTSRLGFTKERKISRMRNILNNTGLEFKEVIHPARPDYTIFYVKSENTLPKTFNWVNLENISSNYARQFLNEVRNWDASSNGDSSFYYVSTNKFNVDVIQSLAVLAGYTTNLEHRVDTRKEHFSDTYRLNIRLSTDQVGERSIKKEIIKYSGRVYCVKVPSGFVVVRRNNKVVVSGNCGKTSFLASELTHMATQLTGDQWIAWLNTEGSWEQIIPRIYCAALDCTAADLRKFTDSAQKKYVDMMGGCKNRIRVLNFQRKSTKDVEDLIKRNPPSLIVFDLLDGLRGFEKYMGEGGNVTERYSQLYQWAREIATSYCPVLAISQLNGDGNNEPYPTITNLRGSRVDKQAAATFQLIIGSLEGNNTERYLSMPKNKISTNKGWRSQVSFNPTRCRFED